MAEGAQVDEVKVTSFLRVGKDIRSPYLAEICGVVKAQGHVAIEIKTDPKNNPAYYTTLPNKSGQFCQVIATFTGTAEVSARLKGGKTLLVEQAGWLTKKQ
jgi:hypothetical protein